MRSSFSPSCDLRSEGFIRSCDLSAGRPRGEEVLLPLLLCCLAGSGSGGGGLLLLGPGRLPKSEVPPGEVGFREDGSCAGGSEPWSSRSGRLDIAFGFILFLRTPEKHEEVVSGCIVRGRCEE